MQQPLIYACYKDIACYFFAYFSVCEKNWIIMLPFSLTVSAAFFPFFNKQVFQISGPQSDCLISVFCVFRTYSQI